MGKIREIYSFVVVMNADELELHLVGNGRIRLAAVPVRPPEDI